MKTQDNPEIFLKEFVSRIVIEKAKKIREEKNKAEKLMPSINIPKKEEPKLPETPSPPIQKYSSDSLNKLLRQNPIPSKTMPRIVPIQRTQITSQRPQTPPIKDPGKRPTLPPIASPTFNMENKTPSVVEKLDFKSLEKLKSILDDPAVISVECAGPGKSIIVNSGGLMKTTQITLTKEEIESIMKDISQKTKIPLSAGVFKAVIGRYLINAVISDFVGTRFVITKRTPFMKY